MKLLVFLLILALCNGYVPSLVLDKWATRTRYNTRMGRLGMFFAEEAASSDQPSVSVRPSMDDDKSMQIAAFFMVDNFWLDTRHTLSGKDGDIFSEAAMANLYQEQTQDFVNTYGERMGQRLLDSCLLLAVDNESDEILGLVGIQVTLFDDESEEIMIPDKAETILKSAVASLGPKDRRRYKNSSADEIAEDLFGDSLTAVCCLSNLSVSPKARRKGIAKKLCDEAERIASVEWGYSQMVLKVESGNTAARELYEKKLSYNLKCSLNEAVAIRVDAEAGCFVQTKADTLLLIKDI